MKRLGECIVYKGSNVSDFCIVVWLFLPSIWSTCLEWIPERRMCVAVNERAICPFLGFIDFSCEEELSHRCKSATIPRSGADGGGFWSWFVLTVGFSPVFLFCSGCVGVLLGVPFGGFPWVRHNSSAPTSPGSEAPLGLSRETARAVYRRALRFSSTVTWTPSRGAWGWANPARGAYLNRLGEGLTRPFPYWLGACCLYVDLLQRLGTAVKGRTRSSTAAESRVRDSSPNAFLRWAYLISITDISLKRKLAKLVALIQQRQFFSWNFSHKTRDIFKVFLHYISYVNPPIAIIALYLHPYLYLQI